MSGENKYMLVNVGHFLTVREDYSMTVNNNQILVFLNYEFWIISRLIIDFDTIWFLKET